ncbi:DUF6881 domain-containing protein [Luteimonas aquatica]|uniref:DUF6881 domain-containing protein n=1 Tax=Luteimonas aquatica TaxID=450364 RepID=UPI001F563ADC|nr:hypothetical protein [Luteimonas aquatica]
MIYLKVRWIHNNLNDPILLFSELDENRNEIRKIEIFANSRIGYASFSESGGETRLGEAPIPDSEEISLDPQFIIEKTDKDEFERMWSNAVRRVV